MKPGRTVGLSLAILASAMLFSILPLTQVALVLTIRYRMQQVNLPVPGETDPDTADCLRRRFHRRIGHESGRSDGSGGHLSGHRNLRLERSSALDSAGDVGRCPGSDPCHSSADVAPCSRPPDLSQGFDSGASIAQTLLSGRLLFSFLVALYVVWYMNRGPARAFYRGYYLQRPDATLMPLNQSNSADGGAFSRARRVPFAPVRAAAFCRRSISAATRRRRSASALRSAPAAVRRT